MIINANNRRKSLNMIIGKASRGCEVRYLVPASIFRFGRFEMVDLTALYALSPLVCGSYVGLNFLVGVSTLEVDHWSLRWSVESLNSLR